MMDRPADGQGPAAMRHETHEVIGTLCRYALLGLTAVGVVALAVVILSGVAGGTFDPQPRIVAPDHITRPRETAYPRVWLTEPRSAAGAGLLVVSPGSADRPVLALSRRPTMFLPTRATRPGPVRMNLRGFPYGPLALVCQEVTMQIIPEDRPVTLVDARLATMAESDAWLETSRQLRRTSDLVYLHAGTLQTYQQSVASLKHSDPLSTVFAWGGQKTTPLHVVLHAVRELGRSRPGPVTLVTGKPDLGWQAVRKGLEVRLIGAREEGRLPPNLQVYPDLRKFKESLAASAIGQ